MHFITNEPTSRNSEMYAIAKRNVSILLKRFSYGNVGTCTRSSSKAELMLLKIVTKSNRRKNIGRMC